jgi:hypothetical protein
MERNFGGASGASVQSLVMLFFFIEDLMLH